MIQIIFGEKLLAGKRDSILEKWNKTMFDKHNMSK